MSGNERQRCIGAVLGTCTRSHTPGHRGCALAACGPEASWPPSRHLRGAPLGLREVPGVFTHHACCALSPYDLDTENRTFPTRHFIGSHLPSGARRPPVVAGIQPLPVDAGSTLALGTPFQQPHTHSCSRLFLTVPGHPSAEGTPGVLRLTALFPRHLGHPYQCCRLN